MQVAPIPVFRPSYLMDGDEFQGDLVESPANIFYQKVNASRATLQRMQFQWRSPSDNLLASPVMFLRTTLKITCPQLWSQVQAYINVHGVLGPSRASDSLGGGAANAVHAGIQAAAAVTAGEFRGQKVPAICFADGDAFTSCCSSINFLFNGTSLGLNRTNRWFRDFLRTQISSDDAAKIYKSSGGRYDQKDQKGIAGVLYNGQLTNAGVKAAVANGAALEAGCQTVAGITQDSGVSDRCRAFFSLLQDGASTGAVPGQPVGGGQTYTARYLQVSYPVPISPLNPWRGAAVPASCPYRKGPLAIPHLSAGGLDFLMEDFEQSFIRRLGRTQATSAAGDTSIAQNGSNASVGVEIVDNETYLEIKYFRLSHTRALKESYRWNVWQAQTFNGKMPPSAPDADGHEAPARAGLVCMTPIGKDIAQGAAAASQLQAATRGGREWQIVFDVINLAQIPSYLLISVPKLAEQYSLAVEHADMENCMRNLSHNLSIKSLKIIVNSARGAIDPSSDITGFIDAERLWEMTKENATSEYFKAGGFRAWRDYQCAVLLHSSQFAPGLQSCDGVAYPVQIQVELTVQNRAVDVTALGIQGTVANDTRAHALSKDYIRARAQCTAIFTKLILATTETSGSTNYMSYPLDSAERVMNSAGALR